VLSASILELVRAIFADPKRDDLPLGQLAPPIRRAQVRLAAEMSISSLALWAWYGKVAWPGGIS
jgi:hypothetical protein